MVRAFAPDMSQNIGSNPEFFKVIKENALERTGEWVRHIPHPTADNEPQWVFMTYQFVPSDASIRAEFVIDGTDPMLFGLADHFITQPEKYRGGHSGKRALGSIFEVNGYLFQAKKVDVNKHGYADITLIRHDKCSGQRHEFCDEVAALGCPS